MRYPSLLALPFLLFAACPTPIDPPEPPLPPAALAFPQDFFWGAAIAGFQVDMGCPTIPADQCEDRNSDWYQWVTDPEIQSLPGTFLSGDPVSFGPGHFELYAEDFARARSELGLNALRTSIEWSRLFPIEPVGAQSVDDLTAFVDQAALAHYHDMFQELANNNLTPLVTINHYTLPLWLHDGKSCKLGNGVCEDAGWLDRDRILREITLFAGFCAREFGAEIDLWGTLNEPTAVIVAGYLLQTDDRTNPPGISNAALALQVALNMIEAHAFMYDAIHAEDTIDVDGNGKAAEVGLVASMADVFPADPDNPEDVEGAEHANYLLNLMFLNGAIRGEFDDNLDGTPDRVRDDLIGRADFWGINYYTRLIAIGTPDPILGDNPLLDFIPNTPFDNFPQGLYDVTMLAASYDIPILITENGTADTSDEAGPKYIVPHLELLHQAIEDGADVRGYFYWTLIDNYEWNHGMDLDFGFFAVDPSDPAKTRVARPSVPVYKQIAETNEISSDLRSQFGVAE